jgi:hypothetical protein
MSNKKGKVHSKEEGKMQKILVFRPYPFKKAQKIFIDSGPRKGDWEIFEVGERKVKLRCPISKREVEWDRFCYLVEECHDIWPHPD